MANQINVTFKNNELEDELYAWLKSKLNTGAYIKETLYNKFLEETQGIVTQKVQVQAKQVVEPVKEVKQEPVKKKVTTKISKLIDDEDGF